MRTLIEEMSDTRERLENYLSNPQLSPIYFFGNAFAVRQNNK